MTRSYIYNTSNNKCITIKTKYEWPALFVNERKNKSDIQTKPKTHETLNYRRATDE